MKRSEKQLPGKAKFASINKIFALAGRLGTRPSFYEVQTLS